MLNLLVRFSFSVLNIAKAWFSYVGKIRDHQGPLQILPIYQICTRGLSQIFPIMNYLFVIGGL